MTLTNAILLELLRATAVTDEALAEARNRRDVVFDAAKTYEGALRTIKSGSVAHGTLSWKVTDADGALVLNRKVYTSYGPDGDNDGPTELVEDIADYMRPLIQQIYPDAWVSTGHKRAIYIRFRQPLSDGQDPSVDLMVSLNRKGAPGLWIPNLKSDTWEASDPATHTALIAAKRKSSNYKSTKVVRLGKLYAKQWDPVLLSSFHVTALMLEDLGDSATVEDGFQSLLAHAAISLEDGDTKDPAGVSDDLEITDARSRDTLVRKLSQAAEHLTAASELEEEDDSNYEAIVERLLKVFWKDELEEVVTQAAQKVKIDRAVERASSTAARTATVVGAGITRPVISARAYASTATHPLITGPTADWYETPSERQWFEYGIAGSEYGLLYTGKQSGAVTYVVSVPIRPYNTSALIKVVIKGKSASVYAPGLTDLRHVNAPDPDVSLCLWYPADPPGRKWRFEYGLIALLDLVQLHIYKEFRFKETGKWPGEEVH